MMQFGFHSGSPASWIPLRIKCQNGACHSGGAGLPISSSLIRW